MKIDEILITYSSYLYKCLYWHKKVSKLNSYSVNSKSGTNCIQSIQIINRLKIKKINSKLHNICIWNIFYSIQKNC